MRYLQSISGVFFALTLLLIGSQVHGAEGDREEYFMAVFASQSRPIQSRYSHTFATFVKARHNPSSKKDMLLETHTISWMPQSLDIVLLRRRPEPGVNLDLASSLRWARSV